MRKALAFLFPAGEAPKSLLARLSDKGEAFVCDIATWLDRDTLIISVPLNKVGSLFNGGALLVGWNWDFVVPEGLHAGEPVQLPIPGLAGSPDDRDAGSLPAVELGHVVAERPEDDEIGPLHA